MQDSVEVAINMDVVLRDLDQITDIFIEHYKDNEKNVLMFKRKNTFEYKVNWKELLAEGRERRHIIDMELYRNTSRIERYLKAKQEFKAKVEALQEK